MKAQDTYFQEYLEKWSNARDYTIKVVELMPEAEFSFKPTEDEMTFQEQTLHLLRNMYWLSSSYLSKDTLEVDFKTFKGDKTALIELMQQVFAFSEKVVQQMETAQLEEK
ncbi:MAG: DinB family protein [Saprospiraceae bacterium]|nr:DinB family protein [Saprospiraceae bacterium]